MENPAEKKEKSRGKDTIFRVASNNQISLIAIADNKANMIIGICVVLISLVIALLGSGFVIQGQPITAQPALLVPMCVLLFFALCSVVFAMLAAKPEIIEDKPASVHSLLFFKNISARTPDQYLHEMQELLEDNNATYDQIITDMYYNGVVLHRKYKLLSTSYILFMIGLIATVVAFTITTVLL